MQAYTILSSIALLLMTTLPSNAEEASPSNSPSDSASCGLDEVFTDDSKNSYIVYFGRNNSIEAYVADPRALTCDDRTSALCGTRGCPLTVYINKRTYEMVGWRVFAMQVELQSLLVVEQSGPYCDGEFPNSQECYALWEWDEERGELRFLR
jgi:hypothetical protein